MNLHELIQYVLKDLGPSLHAVWPELSLAAAIVLLLLARMIFPARKAAGLPYCITFWGPGRALVPVPRRGILAAVSPGQQFAVAPAPQAIFTGLLVLDSFSIVIRGLLMLFAVLFVTFTRVSGVPNDDDATEFYVMILGATIGLCIMVSANHVLMVFLGIEMASVPCYVLAGILRHRRASSEAALKYAVFGGGRRRCDAVRPQPADRRAGLRPPAHHGPAAGRRGSARRAMPITRSTAVVLVLGGLMTMVGLAFKLSAVPFHFWAPDVFEGAPAEVGTFLSIASKAAAVALLTRLALIFSGCLEPLPAAARPSRPWPRCGSIWPRSSPCWPP